MTSWLHAAGGLAPAFLLLSELADRSRGLWQRWKRASALRQAKSLDWKIIEETVNSERLRRDCERPESLGVCTGLDCMVYQTCNFNIKKVVH